MDLWKTSGHFDFYRDSMFDQMDVESEQYQLKPMNCPFHVSIYKTGYYSYRDLPLRWAELGTVYRYERSGTMHGLFRVRGFTQDDAHIFCLPEQVGLGGRAWQRVPGAGHGGAWDAPRARLMLSPRVACSTRLARAHPRAPPPAPRSPFCRRPLRSAACWTWSRTCSPPLASPSLR